MTASHALSQLSYGPIWLSARFLADVSAGNDRGERCLIQSCQVSSRFCLLPTALLPPPRYVINSRQLVQVRPQHCPIFLRVLLQSFSAHELINLRPPIQTFFHTPARRFLT